MFDQANTFTFRVISGSLQHRRLIELCSIQHCTVLKKGIDNMYVCVYNVYIIHICFLISQINLFSCYLRIHLTPTLLPTSPELINI